MNLRKQTCHMRLPNPGNVWCLSSTTAQQLPCWRLNWQQRYCLSVNGFWSLIRWYLSKNISLGGFYSGNTVGKWYSQALDYSKLVCFMYKNRDLGVNTLCRFVAWFLVCLCVDCISYTSIAELLTGQMWDEATVVNCKSHSWHLQHYTEKSLRRDWRSRE